MIAVGEQQLPPSDRAETTERNATKDCPLTTEQRGIVNKLARLQEELKKGGRRLTDADFARLLGLKSAARWSRIRSLDYFNDVQNPGIVIHELRRALERYSVTTKYQQQFEDKDFLSNEVFEAVFAAVEECTRKKLADRKRIVVYTGRTGMGKTMLAWQLRERYGAVVVNANKAWRKPSGKAALAQICGALHGCINDNTYATRLEDSVLAELQSQPYVLVVDESEYFSSGIIDSFKRFINESNVVLVFMSYPEAYRAWNARYSMQAEQLKTRTHAIFDSYLTVDMVIPFLRRLAWENEEEIVSCAEFVTRQANILGGYDLVDSVVTKLLERRGKVNHIKFKTAQADELRRMISVDPTPCKALKEAA
jgi:hypothetical protein